MGGWIIPTYLKNKKRMILNQGSRLMKEYKRSCEKTGKWRMNELSDKEIDGLLGNKIF